MISLNQVILAMTFQLVHQVVEYIIVAVGAILSKASRVLKAFILLLLVIFQLSEGKLSPFQTIADFISE
jgi:hypothetical protein